MTSIGAERAGDTPLDPPTRRNRLTERFAWCAALATAAVAFVVVDFVSQDPDSSSYAMISARLASLPVRSWIAPEWWGMGGSQGLFREHPVGVFVVPALLGKLGVPPLQAPYVVGAVFSIAAVLLIRRVAGLIVGTHLAVAAAWVSLILPVAFINRIRATQEYPVLVFMLLAVYATQRARRSAPWIAVLVAAACATVLVKGIFVVFVPIVCGLWLVCVRDGEPGDARAWFGLALSVASVVLLAFAYEGLYRRVTGDTFLGYYLPYRFGQIATVDQAATAVVARKVDNVFWYSARLLWFGFPGTLALLVAMATRMRGPRQAAARRNLQGLWFAIGTALAYIGVMSLGSTRAERFILPAYFAIGVAGSLVAARRWGGPARFAERLGGLPPFALPLAWLLLVLAALPFELYVPYVKFR
jgi:4-amino-4-deoxy-L-arabinose transferase-like glycosyltransferase